MRIDEKDRDDLLDLYYKHRRDIEIHGGTVEDVLPGWENLNDHIEFDLEDLYDYRWTEWKPVGNVILLEKPYVLIPYGLYSFRVRLHERAYVNIGAIHPEHTRKIFDAGALDIKWITKPKAPPLKEEHTVDWQDYIAYKYDPRTIIIPFPRKFAVVTLPEEEMPND